MAQTSYQVILSTDGKHTVIAQSDDPEAAKTALAWVKATYDAVVARYGLKHEQYHKNGEQSGNGEQNAKEAVPNCAVHHTPMTKQNGKYGEFWSCHQRNADSSFCSYRPNGH